MAPIFIPRPVQVHAPYETGGVGPTVAGTSDCSFKLSILAISPDFLPQTFDFGDRTKADPSGSPLKWLDLGRAMPVLDNQPTRPVGPSCFTMEGQVRIPSTSIAGAKAMDEKEQVEKSEGQSSRGKSRLHVPSSSLKEYLPCVSSCEVRSMGGRPSGLQSEHREGAPPGPPVTCRPFLAVLPRRPARIS
ncbi:hypothetical protein CSAL01_04550 [Colletotrichum salicis]|uniref:Uncharacterized protein n=1 Tax=Colletotrichum salicis TaxID=1209931 RepID=A0A135USQ9_9PEZI|nr:hypothetical protein CSAL01_04550 [Colletotrichum salicis]